MRKGEKHGERLRRENIKVNLTTKTFDVECPTEDFYRKYIGGSSLSTYFLLKEMEPGIDALDPESLLILRMDRWQALP